MNSQIADRATAQRTLRLIWSALLFAVVGFIIVACWMGPGLPREAPLPQAVIYLLTAVAVTNLIAGIVMEKVLLAKAARAEPLNPTSPAAAQASFQASIVGGALRESAGLIGGILTLMTGEPLWALSLGGAAVISLLAAWPRLPTGTGIEPE